MSEAEAEKPLHTCLCKATTAEGKELRRSFNWVTARRALLEVWPDRLVCGDWTIPYDEIEDALLGSFRQFFVMPGFVLAVTTGERTYQFGLNYGRYWKGELPFPARRERIRLAFSPYAIVVRVFLVGLITYWIWTRCIEPA